MLDLGVEMGWRRRTLEFSNRNAQACALEHWGALLSRFTRHFIFWTLLVIS